jgi:hypothetical protein
MRRSLKEDMNSGRIAGRGFGCRAEIFFGLSLWASAELPEGGGPEGCTSLSALPYPAIIPWSETFGSGAGMQIRV